MSLTPRDGIIIKVALRHVFFYWKNSSTVNTSILFYFGKSLKSLISITAGDHKAVNI